MSKKVIYLSLALLLPALIFVFLKYFGKNEFDIPVFYANGVGDSSAVCKIKTTGQYYISDSAFSSLKCNRCETMLIVEGNRDEGSQLKELNGGKGFSDLGTAFLSDLFPANEKENFKSCVLFMRSPWNAVLVDKQRRIRGYYKLGNRDEMDRLEVELKILLKKY